MKRQTMKKVKVYMSLLCLFLIITIPAQSRSNQNPFTFISAQAFRGNDTQPVDPTNFRVGDTIIIQGKIRYDQQIGKNRIVEIRAIWKENNIVRYITTPQLSVISTNTATIVFTTGVTQIPQGNWVIEFHGRKGNENFEKVGSYEFQIFDLPLRYKFIGMSAFNCPAIDTGLSACTNMDDQERFQPKSTIVVKTDFAESSFIQLELKADWYHYGNYRFQSPTVTYTIDPTWQSFFYYIFLRDTTAGISAGPWEVFIFARQTVIQNGKLELPGSWLWVGTKSFIVDQKNP